MDKNEHDLISTALASKTTWLPLNDLPQSANLALQAQLIEAHRLVGATIVDGEMAVLAFRLSQESRFILNLADKEMKFLPYAWCLGFGAAMSVSAYSRRESSGLVPRVFLESGSAALPFMARGKFRCVFYAGNNPARYCEVDFGERLKREVDNVRAYQAPLYRSDAALFWEIMEALTDTHEYLRPEERLSIGWQNNYQGCVRSFLEARDEIMAHCEHSGYKDAGLPASIVEFFDACLPSGFNLGIVADFATSIFSSRSRFEEFAMAHDSVCAFAGIPPSGWPSITILAMQIGLRTPATTACGRKVVWVKVGGDTDIGVFEPDAANFPKFFNPEEYWHRIPYLLPHWGLGALVARADVPLSVPPNSALWARFPQTDPENRAETIAVADCLIDEAATNKRWIIPSRAIIQTPAGPFTHFEVSEFANEDMVFFVGRTERGEFAILTFEMTHKALYFPELVFLKRSDEPLYDSIYAALKLLLAAIVRDFWVVEERESVFAATSLKRLAGVRMRATEDGSPRVVYLPRIRYKEKPTPQKCAEALDHKARAAHYVNQHIRKVDRPSDAQIILAKSYGCHVPEGYTFVRPHERGMRSARAIIYRSRSALQSLYQLDQTLPVGIVEWFRFEKDVEQFLKKAGFHVQHRAAARNGDQGVDLYATKGVDLEAVNWIIQCKCYHLGHLIGPDKLRELHGVVVTYPAGTRGMMITTSAFTSGARALAAELNIRLMDGAEFARRLNAG